MKFLRWLSLSALALSLAPSIASADEPPLAERMQHQIEHAFLQPLAKRESHTSRFSRSQPPRERRVRILQTSTSRDQAGRAFLPFAIDARYTDEWVENNMRGCIYTEKGDTFIEAGETYLPASFFLGVAAKPVTGVCKAAPPPRA